MTLRVPAPAGALLASAAHVALDAPMSIPACNLYAPAAADRLAVITRCLGRSA